MEEGDTWLEEKMREIDSGRLSKVDFLNQLEEHNERMRENIEEVRNQFTTLQKEADRLRDEMARLKANRVRMEAELRED